MSPRKRTRVIPGPRRSTEVNNIICVSDIHAGCKLAICPPHGIDLDDGGTYYPSPLQKKLWAMWREFWDDWVPAATRGEPYIIVINGDAVEGNHHKVTTPISLNPIDQFRILEEIVRPQTTKPKAKALYMIRGTQAHVGVSASSEEAAAQALGALPNKEGQYCRWDLWKHIGDNKLVHFLHHVGTTSSQAYESTAIYKELVEMFIEAARWRKQPPDIVVRSHRHRALHASMPTGEPLVSSNLQVSVTLTSEAHVIVTPAWQSKTAFAWQKAGSRVSYPHFGGICIRWSTKDKVLYPMSKVWTVERSETE